MYILKEDVAIINQHDGYKRYILQRNAYGYFVVGYDQKLNFLDVEYFNNREDAMQFLCNLVDKLNGREAQMTREKFIQKVTSCRVIVDDLVADVYKLEDKDIRWESICRTRRALDEIDALLNYLKSEGVKQND